MSTATTPAITNLAAVIVPVADQDEWSSSTPRRSASRSGRMSPSARASRVAGSRWPRAARRPRSPSVRPGPDNEAGGRETGISLRTADIKAYHAQLKERGVDVDDEVSEMGEPVPPLFWLRDPEGNQLMVVETAD